MPNLPEKAAILTTTLCTAVVIVICWFAIALHQNVLPYWDSWGGYIGYMLRFDDMTLGAKLLSLFEQHNEHRFLFTRLLFIIDFYVFNASFTSLYIFNALAPLIPVAVIYAALKGENKVARILLSLLAASILYSLQQRENFYWEFQSQFFLAQYIPFLGYYLIVRYWSASLLRNVIRWGAMTAVCAFTMANGLFFALPLAIFFIPHKEHRAYALAASLSFVVIYVFYFHILPYRHIEGHGSFRTDVLPNLGRYLNYNTTYVGSPFGRNYASGMGGLFIVTALFIFWKSMWSKPAVNMRSVFLLYIIFYGISVAATGIGRVNFGTAQALSDRYLTPTLLAWICIAIFLVLRFEYFERLKTRMVIGSVILSALLVNGQVFEAGRKNQNKLVSKELAHLALDLEVPDHSIIQTVVPTSDYAFSIYEESQRQGLSFTQNHLGFPAIKSTLSPIDTSCPGAIDSIKIIGKDTLQVDGWMIDSANLKTLKPLVYIEGGIVKGLGLHGVKLPDVARAIAPPRKNSGFRLYVKTAHDSTNIGAIQSAASPASCSLKSILQ